MKKEDLLKKSIALIGASGIMISSLSSCSLMKFVGKSVKQKPDSNVSLDVKNFNVDDSVAIKLKDNKYLRLKFSEDRPVIVDCHKNIGVEEKQLISDVVDYYNEIFSTINENYKFVVKDENTKVLASDTVIKIKNAKLPSSIYGYALGFRNLNMDNSGFINDAVIRLDWEDIKKFGDSYAYYVILHEMCHVLGMGDVYYKADIKNNDLNMNTIMQQGEINDGLFPNDYALLQALYSNEYTKHDNYEDAIKVVNKKIEQYTYEFYCTYAKFLKRNMGAEGTLEVKDLSQSIKWQGNDKYNSHLSYELKFDNGDCELIITNKNGDILEKTFGKTYEANGVVFIRDMYILKSSNYSEKYQADVAIKLMLSIYKNSDNQIIVRDVLSNAMQTNVFLNDHSARMK